MSEQEPPSQAGSDQANSTCLPPTAEAEAVETVASLLAQGSAEPRGTRAAARTTRDHDVELVVDGSAIRPIETSGGVRGFVVPRGARSVVLKSLFSIQGELVPPYTSDARRLGVRVAEITVRSDAGQVVISPDDPRLTTGWHDAERDGVAVWRWTDGAAQLPWTGITGPAVVTIRYSGLAEYPSEDSPTVGHLGGDARPRPVLSRAKPNMSAPKPGGPVRLQWCLGMYSSGSTWAFNAIRLVGDALFPGEPHVGAYVESVNDLPPGWSESDRLTIKSHHADEAATGLLIGQVDRIWISIRDPRDSVASASTYIFSDFDAALDAVTRSALHCERFIHDARSVVLRYEDGFIDDPATLDRLAAVLSRSLSPEVRDRLFQQTRRGAIEAMIKQFDPNETVDDGFSGHRVHMETQWHTHHMNRTGEVGRWRHTLDPAQAVKIEQRLGSWMKRFGYLP